MAFLTDRTLATGVTANDLIHIVITGDTSQNPSGSSYKATMSQVLDLINPTTLTGGTYDPITGTITFYDDNGGSFNVTGLITGYTNTTVTGFTYDDANTFTILENDGTTHSTSINVVTGMTFNGFLQTSGSSASGLYSFAFGNNTTSSGDYSFSQGRITTASGNWSHSEGRATNASGLNSHAEGTNTNSSGISSHAEGDSTTSSGSHSHSEGQSTLASGDYSHTEGSGTTTYGLYSHAEGLGTITNGDYQLTIGQFNSTASTQSAFIIGNGTSDTNRSNLVFATGSTFNIYGNLNVTGTTSSGTISATTYQNLPTDVRVTGATYSNNTFTYTNNTGGTFNVLFNSVTGLTVNGNLNVTGNTTLSATTASTLNISSTPLVDSGLTTYYLTRDSSNGDVKTKIIPGATVYGLFAQTGNSVAVSATTVESTIIDGGIGTLLVPANGFSVGDSFRADFGGLLSAKNNDTIRIKVKTGSVILADSGTQTMTTAINDVFQFSINFTIRKIGAVGVAEIVALGVFHTTKQSNGSQTGFAFNTVNSTTFDTTISNTLDVTAQWSSNSALNSIYSDIFILNKIF